MQVQVIINNDVAWDPLNGAFSSAKHSTGGDGNSQTFRLNHPPSLSHLHRHLNTITALPYDYPQWSNLCPRQPGDNTHGLLKETKPLSEPKTPVVDAENNMVHFVKQQKIAQRRAMRIKGGYDNGTSPSAGVAKVTLPMARRSNATGAKALSA